MARSPIVMITDFGLSDGYPGVMKGVIYSFCPNVPIIDLSHGIPSHNLSSAAFLLYRNYIYFPGSSIFVTVVDPGVGSSRKILYLRWGDWHFLAPDNGILSPFLLDTHGIKEIRQVTQSDLFLARRGNTFDGRDRFAPVAAHLASGFKPTDLGPELDTPVILEDLIPAVKKRNRSLIGQVIYIDSFGNLITTIDELDIQSCKPQEPLYALILRQKIPIAESYSEVDPGKPLAVMGGFGVLEIAVNQGNAQKMLGVPVGQTVEVVLSK